MADDIDQEIEAMFGVNNDTPAESASSTAGTSESTPDTSTSGTEDASTNNDSVENPAKPDSTNPEASKSASNKESENSQNFSAEEHFNNKQNKAFAEMRIKNKDYEQFLMQMALAANLNVKNAQEAKNVLSEKMQQIVAKQKNMDPQVLKELEESRRRISEMESARLKEHTLTDFARLKTLHGLSDSDLGKFADLLISKNKNPFEQEMDLVNEYRLLNFDKLIEQAREEGRQEEIARSTKAQTSSTNPGNQRAATENTGEPKTIKNTDELSAFFKSIGL